MTGDMHTLIAQIGARTKKMLPEIDGRMDRNTHMGKVVGVGKGMCMYVCWGGRVHVRYVCKHAYGVPVSTLGVFPRSQSTNIFLGQRIVETD